MFSIYIIAKNEEPYIQKCIDSAKQSGCTDIIVGDNCSSDLTKSIAQKNGVRVVDLEENIFPSVGFGSVYNLMASHCVNNWVLNLPGDCYIANPSEILKIVRGNGSNYHWVQFYRPNGDDKNYKKFFDFKHGRLYNKESVCFSKDLIHENLVDKRTRKFLQPKICSVDIIAQDIGKRRDLHNILEHWLLLKTLLNRSEYLEYLNAHWTTTYYTKNKDLIKEDAKRIREKFPNLSFEEWENYIDKT